MTTLFSELNLHPQLVQAVSERGYAEPTPIQSSVIPAMLDGQDVIGQAQTGTGKTAAFALPILHNLEPARGHVQCLVLAPTRELALQVAQSFHAYGHHRGASVLPVYGGQPYSRQISRLRRGVDVVVGTPGRLLDLLDRGALDLSNVQFLVLDEADEMLSMGFIEDIETLLAATPAGRQTALFSATMPAEIRRLADRYMRQPQFITVEREQLTVPAIEQRYYLVNRKDKMAALTRLFEVETIASALIFVRTRIESGKLANALTVRGFPAEALNGDLSQDMREQALNRFRNGQIQVLVATDVAARGLDIDGISHVFNYDLPQDEEWYVHRIGRTGRAGRTGVAITLLTPDEQWHLRRIEWYIKQEITRCELPTAQNIETQREAQLLERVMVWLHRGRSRRERELVAQLAEAGYDPLDIAAAALKVARSEERQRPVAAVSEVQEERPRRQRQERPTDSQRNDRSREAERPSRRNERNGRSSKRNERNERSSSHEAGMVRLTLSAGKAQGIRPNDVVGSIAFHAGIPGRAIGAIRIQEQHTLVDVPEQFVAQVLDKASTYRLHQQVVNVALA